MCLDYLLKVPSSCVRGGLLRRLVTGGEEGRVFFVVGSNRRLSRNGQFTLTKYEYLYCIIVLSLFGLHRSFDSAT